MKNRFFIFASSVTLFFVANIVFNMARFYYSFSDALARTLLAPIEGTVWPEGFSESAFANLKIGMTMDDVRSLVGKPMKEACYETEAGPGCTWNYTVHEIVEHYDRRRVDFDANNHVESIEHEFYID